MKEVPFCPCEWCAWIQERDSKHVIREAAHVIVLPEDAEHEIAGMALCNEHHDGYWRFAEWREQREERVVQ